MSDGTRVRLTFGSSALAYEIETDPNPQIVRVNGKEFVRGKPIHIFPFGEWAAIDGRKIAFSEQDAAVLIENANSRRNDLAITFDHEKHDSKAGGWMQKFEMRPDGLWATDVKWVKETYTALRKGEYRYLSGDAFGLGNGTDSAPFRPRRLLAASLVPKPAIDGLNEIQLSARNKAANIEKETDMESKERIEKFRARLGLAADVPEDQVMAAVEKAVEEKFAFKDLLDSRKGKHEDGCKDMKCEGCAEEGEATEQETCSKGGTKMSAMEPNEDAKAAGTDVAKAAVAASLDVVKATAKEEAEKQTREAFAAEKKNAGVEQELLAAEKDGRLVPAEREKFREMLMSADEKAVAFAREILTKAPVKAPTDRLPQSVFSVTGTGVGGGAAALKEMLFHADGQPKYKETSTFLTQVARFSAYKNVSIDVARNAVLKGENVELEQQLFAAASKTAEDFGGQGEAGIGEFRASKRQIPVDPEMIAFVQKRIKAGYLPEALVPAEIQQFAALADFQPAARTTLPMALGYVQSEFVGDEALPVFVGGADEKAAWPEFGFEKFAAVAEKAALLGAPNRTSINVTWHTVTLDKYPIQVDIDRRARAASVTLPRGIDTIAMENAKAQVGVTKELAQYTLLATTGNYSSSTFYPTLGTPWSTPGNPAAYAGVPITDISLGMNVIRAAVRSWPDLLLLSPSAALAMRKNQQIIDTVRYTGTMERPGTMVSDATLAAIFRGIFNITIVVGGAGYSSLPTGASPTDVWGKDAWLVCTGQGQIEAPRFGMTITAAGSPRVRAFPNELLGADGSDSLVYTDAWSVVAVNNKAAYWMKSASA